MQNKNEAIHTEPIFCSTWYPLLLGGQRRCGFKACLRLLHMTRFAGIEPQTPRSRVQRLNRLVMHSSKSWCCLLTDLTNVRYNYMFASDEEKYSVCGYVYSKRDIHSTACGFCFLFVHFFISSS